MFDTIDYAWLPLWSEAANPIHQKTLMLNLNAQNYSCIIPPEHHCSDSCLARGCQAMDGGIWSQLWSQNEGHFLNTLPLSFHPPLLLHLLCSRLFHSGLLRWYLKHIRGNTVARLWCFLFSLPPAVLLPSPSSLFLLQDRSLNPRTGVETRNLTIFRMPADGEDADWLLYKITILRGSGHQFVL